MTIRMLAADEVEAFRAVRLRALSVDPGAFCSTHAREATFSHAEWSARLAGFDGRAGVVLVDESPGAVIGMVGVGLAAEPGVAILWGMWVAPEGRGRGSGRALLAAALDAARGLGASIVELEVLTGNDAAARLYERSGFVDVGPGEIEGGRRMVATR